MRERKSLPPWGERWRACEPDEGEKHRQKTTPSSVMPLCALTPSPEGEGYYRRTMTFKELNLSAPLLRAVQEAGYETPSPIQA